MCHRVPELGPYRLDTDPILAFFTGVAATHIFHLSPANDS